MYIYIYIYIYICALSLVLGPDEIEQVESYRLRPKTCLSLRGATCLTLFVLYDLVRFMCFS